MKAGIALLVVATIACQRHDLPMHPFKLTSWTSFPTDDALVAAIVGDGGSTHDRARIDRAMRELALPHIKTRAGGDVALLSEQIEQMRGSYDNYGLTPDPVDRLVEVALGVELSDLQQTSAVAAEIRLHDLLWPAGPYPEAWVKSPPTSAADLREHVQMLERRLARVESDYAAAARKFQTALLIARNNLAVARDGTYDVTNGQVYAGLVERGVRTRRLPGEFPY
jgi:hypothetical protein